MFVCLDWGAGFFLRINTSNKFKPCVALSVDRNRFLDHDSFLECSLLELDEFEAEESLRRSGLVGTVDIGCAGEVLQKLLAAPYIRASDKDDLRLLFGEQLKGGN